MRPKRPNASALLLCAISAASVPLCAAALRAQQSAGAAPSSHVRVIRAVAGAKGEVRNGTFIMTELRSTFYAPEDREIIVYFEWESAKGVHHCEGSVHGPNGEFASMSSFDYVATQSRFVGFWKVPLSESSPQGAWTFESKVDGQAAGQIPFQVVVASKPAGLARAALPDLPPLPTPTVIYANATAAAVDVDSLDPNGHILLHSSGFALQDGTILTSFRSIDGATTLRVHLSTGTTMALPAIVAGNRRQDWVVLVTNAKTNSTLKLAEPKSWNIGDHCYWLNVRPDGTRVFADSEIVGLPSPAWGDRIDLSEGYTAPTVGGALLNDRGEVIGILGGALPEALVGYVMMPASPGITLSADGGIAVPATLLPSTLPTTPVTLQELWSKGLMTPPVAGSKYVLYGMLMQGSASDKKSLLSERELKLQFQKGDALANVLILFSDSDSLKSTATLKLYDADNHVLVASKPEKVNVNRGEHAERVWQVPLANLPAGVYRVDVELTEGVAWRQYFKLTD
jgi:trypsin-like peptidase